MVFAVSSAPRSCSGTTEKPLAARTRAPVDEQVVNS